MTSFYFRRRFAIPYDEKDGYSKCSMYDVDFKYLHSINQTEPNPNWPKKSCVYGWEYNFTEIPYSTVATEVIKNIFKFLYP